MKKTLLALTLLTALSASTVFAAPVNDLAKNETAIGAGTNESYIEHKFTKDVTVGYQYSDRDEYGHMNDIYGQYEIVNNVRAVVGYRNHLPGNSNNLYGGIAVSTPRVMGAEAYASYVTGADFNEAQVGINYALVANVDLNLNYHNFGPDHGNRENGIGVGATVKF
jgi:hypothetical protein